MSSTSTNLSNADVLKIAKLAHITLKDEEINTLATELSSIISYIGKLDELDTSSVAPMNQVTGLRNVTRGDEITPETVLTQEEALSNAPQKKNNLFEVDAVFDND
ncbi:hypothetical protein A3D80_04525 [Candidatus Roizmanbacteria bacterium RIFCSPHIGHO2_02_FULL_40_13b]|uniref:Aspartyl/glutamyl-tRNA(Asn/Gln) amidotransferase subunit C n=1 Tax=Candidatus Roizmanbacteria bacterium RIFCSPHIGHO2_01_FULL_39_24 TaxID=1802032 RepID=A0A1F7GGM6_9BACT|nr:MAG: hypothetical protein A2799_04535 [Candidatus Roizmanbacteria bacterium RIFCSPHIGHO2_01_FULL_39_24]OGK26430.1 MAG: hypothetical protein A3D80_04525 [Candidatus Roizmanbacteria bacterium RIFCSPHIGHO2_02_FULL_40_13b]OGK49042.1 MAG: hypothetical protein A3A56_03365 [Candidatus Roizmanbacteria bacterium RIFCSPLOWO2_01_FULL_40_32]OGK57528.1 MAG: hypothetical protein A3H83_03135 [Candidatus Roizmanbacteria bacterium RIFCSPLOWO2_02_FULL_39_8]